MLAHPIVWRGSSTTSPPHSAKASTARSICGSRTEAPGICRPSAVKCIRCRSISDRMQRQPSALAGIFHVQPASIGPSRFHDLGNIPADDSCAERGVTADRTLVAVGRGNQSVAHQVDHPNVHGGQALGDIDSRGAHARDVRAGRTNTFEGRGLSKVLDVVRLLEDARGMEMKQTRPENRRDRELLAAAGVTRPAAAADGRSETLASVYVSARATSSSALP